MMVTPIELQELGEHIRNAGEELSRAAFRAVQYERRPVDRQNIYNLYRSIAIRDAAQLLANLHVRVQDLEGDPRGRELLSHLRISAALRESHELPAKP